MTREERVQRQLRYHELIDSELERLKGDEKLAFIREMVCKDVYFLLYYVLNRKDICYEEWEKGEYITINGVALDLLRKAYGDDYKCRHEGNSIWVRRGKGDIEYEKDGKIIERYYRPFLFERCQEIQRNPDGYLDVWSRDHYKTTCITYALTMQEILKNPEVTICIYSFNISTAQKMVEQIKNDLQSNATLLACFPDVLFKNTNATTWTDDKGHKHKMVWSSNMFNVKRKTNPKEHTLECSGLVTGQKTGGHFNLLVYDDTVTPESVTTTELIKKTTERFKMSINTGSTSNMRIRMIGTRYAEDDTYKSIMKEHIAIPRIFTCTTDGTDDVSKSVLYTPEILAQKLSKMTGYVSASQMFCKPHMASAFQFEKDWIPERVIGSSLNLDDYNWYIIVDPAIKVSNDADYTVMWVIGATKDQKYLCADIIRDKLDPSGKRENLFKLVARYTNSKCKPTVFYENVSMQADIPYIEEWKKRDGIEFPLIRASGKPRLTYGTVGQNTKNYKELRIMALEPLFRAGRVIFVDSAIHTNWKGEKEDMLASFFEEEYTKFPATHHDDGLDALSRIADLETGPLIEFPESEMFLERKKIVEYDPFNLGEYQPY